MGRGQGALIRISNQSSKTVEIKLIEGRKIDDMGLDRLQGTLEPGQQFPSEGGREHKGRRYQYIEGEVRNRFQKDGYFTLQAHPQDDTPCSKLGLVVDHDSWICRDSSLDLESSVVMVAYVDECQDDDNFKIEIRIYDNFDGAKWMEQLGDSHDLGKQPLCRVGLPGTHDSCTYKFDADKGNSPDSAEILGVLPDMILSQIFERLCQCQSLSTKEQLERGIRYLDLRVGYHPESDSFATCHGVFCVDVKEVLQELAEFLEANPKEVVIVEFKKLYGMDEQQNQALVQIIDEALGAKMANFFECPPTAPLNDFWEKGYQAVVLYQNFDFVKESNGKLWSLGCLDSPWPEAGDHNELYSKLTEKVSQLPESKLFCAQGILTPDAELIKRSILTGGGLSIRQIAKRCNGKVVDWLEEEWKPNRKVNIVIVDFFQDSNLIPAVINYNRHNDD
eukprot:CAMPEP_0176147498 /NCGR_PEP_ID=MMETSP0120_2-20121206/75192_1 /TAXON_ID=160619 /ORGANISM="Kryptoperidinium foliaceum, Strain CCMP 1326" /LENGTH=447 /DNA_ID=CAMNT_0017484117 /DNA_START=65 /DNA_END=1408 /DNA_ORIENTATION=-